MEDENKNKHDYLLHLLSQGDAMVCLDARRPGVSVPPQHKKDPALNLILNLNFKRPIDIDPETIFATLAFAGRPHRCVIPFTAVWAIYEPATKKGQVWEEDIPQDLDFSTPATPKKSPEPEKKASVRPFTAKPMATLKPEDAPADTRPKRDRSHLRVIK